MISWTDDRGVKHSAVPKALFVDGGKTFAVVPRGMGTYDTGTPYQVREVTGYEQD